MRDDNAIYEHSNPRTSKSAPEPRRTRRHPPDSIASTGAATGVSTAVSTIPLKDVGPGPDVPDSPQKKREVRMPETSRAEPKHFCPKCRTVEEVRDGLCRKCGVTISPFEVRVKGQPPALPPMLVYESGPRARLGLAPSRTAPNPAPVGAVCRLCGSQPAVAATFVQSTGMGLLWRKQTFDGPFCHLCGTATFRDRMNRTLLTGWWGVISFFANFIFVGANLSAFRAVSRLGSAHPTSLSDGRQPLATGASLWHRAGIWVSLAALLIVVYLILGVTLRV